MKKTIIAVVPILAVILIGFHLNGQPRSGWEIVTRKAVRTPLVSPKKSNSQLLLDLIRTDLRRLDPDATDAKVNGELASKLARSNVVLHDLSVTAKDGRYVANCLSAIQALQGKGDGPLPERDGLIMQCLGKMTVGDSTEDVMKTARFIVLEDSFKSVAFGTNDVGNLGNRPINPTIIKNFYDTLFRNPNANDGTVDPKTPAYRNEEGHGGYNPEYGEGGFIPGGNDEQKSSECADDAGLTGEGGNVKKPGGASEKKGIDPLKDWIHPEQHVDMGNLGALKGGGYDLGGCFGLDMAKAGIGAGKPVGGGAQGNGGKQYYTTLVDAKVAFKDRSQIAFAPAEKVGDDVYGTMHIDGVTFKNTTYKTFQATAAAKVKEFQEKYGPNSVVVDSTAEEYEADPATGNMLPTDAPPKDEQVVGGAGYGDPTGDSSSPCTLSVAGYYSNPVKGIKGAASLGEAATVAVGCTAGSGVSAACAEWSRTHSGPGFGGKSPAPSDPGDPLTAPGGNNPCLNPSGPINDLNALVIDPPREMMLNAMQNLQVLKRFSK